MRNKNIIVYKLLSCFYKIYLIIKMLIFKILSLPFLFFPVKNQVVASSYYGRDVSENSKVIVDQIASSTSYQCVWLVNQPDKYKDKSNISYIKNSFFNQLKYLSTSKVWLDNSRKQLIPIKRKNQTYIQFWHGGLGMKKVESDTNTYNWFGSLVSKLDSKMTDIMISNSKHLTKVFRSAFNFKGDIFELGYPMNDSLITYEYDIGDTKEVIRLLYAPTFRDNEVPGVIPDYFPNLDKLIADLNEKGPYKYEIYVRLHPRLAIDVQELYTNPLIKDGNRFESIRELIPSIDFLISDYSSSIFDASIAGIPGVLFVKDFKQYSSHQGLYFSLEELPFEYACTSEELYDIIVNFNYKKYLENIDFFHKKVELKDDGNSTERVISLVLDCLKR